MYVIHIHNKTNSTQSYLREIVDVLKKDYKYIRILATSGLLVRSLVLDIKSKLGRIIGIRTYRREEERRSPKRQAAAERNGMRHVLRTLSGSLTGQYRLAAYARPLMRGKQPMPVTSHIFVLHL